MPLAGDIIEAGRIPGWRIATDIAVSDSSTFTGTAIVVQSVTAPLVAGRTYRVVFSSGFEITVDGVLRCQIKEDNLAGTSIQIRDMSIDNSGTATGMEMQVEHTAIATSNKTFIVSGEVEAGGGTANMNASAGFPSYLFVEYLSG